MNYYLNFAEDQTSVRAKAERDADGNIVLFHLDSDLFFLFYGDGTVGPMNITYDDSLQVTGMWIEYILSDGSGSIDVFWSTVNSFTDFDITEG